MAVGVSLAFLDVDIVPVAAAIGLATLTMVTAGVLLGRVLGVIAGRRAEILGGLLLIGIGCSRSCTSTWCGAGLAPLPICLVPGPACMSRSPALRRSRRPLRNGPEARAVGGLRRHVGRG
jgi:hypothetical protein